MDGPMSVSPCNSWVLDGNAEERQRRTETLIRRSTLFVPTHIERYIEKAVNANADAILLDLEDGVPLDKKDEGRKRLCEAVKYLSGSGADILVRVNKPFSMAVEDLDACAWPGLSGVILPKTESAIEIEILNKLIEEREIKRGIQPGTIEIGILVETVIGFAHLLNIAQSSFRCTTINLGTEDFSKDLGIDPFCAEALLVAKSQVVLAANLGGLQPLGLLRSVSDFKDLDELYQNARMSYRVGFKGSSCIHPAQVRILNQAFSPTPAEIGWAQRICEAYEQARAQGNAVVSVDGKMVDLPIVQRALSMLDRVRRMEERDAQKGDRSREV